VICKEKLNKLLLFKILLFPFANNTGNLLRELSDNFDELISWAELYEDASFEKKKMIANLLIKRIEVCSGYKVNIDFEQFLTGLDKVA